jgi:protoheme IX farnesyltransferase
VSGPGPAAPRRRPLGSVRRPRRTSIGETVGAYVALTKPRIIELLLVTTVPTMVLAEQGMPSLWLVLATLVGGSLAAGSANALNCYYDRDIDQLMHRTSRRPLARRTVAPFNAMVFGSSWACWRQHPLGDDHLLSASWRSARSPSTSSSTPCCSSAGPRRTSSGGGAAGCMPVLIGLVRRDRHRRPGRRACSSW